MIRALKILFSVILLLMIAVSIWATLQKDVWTGFLIVWNEPWGVATLADAACGFITFYAWVCYKERTMVARIGWLIAIFALGNIAMAFYMLRILFRLSPDARAEDILLRRPA